MPICQNCGMMFTSPNGCPYCNLNNQDITYIHQTNDHNPTSQSTSNTSNLVDVEIPSYQQSFESQIIEEDYDYEPRNYIICQNCTEKNKRTNSHCVKCGHPLPIYDHRAEIKAQDQMITQLLDPNVKNQYFPIGLHLFISKLIGKEKKVRCNNMIQDPNDPNNVVSCNQILTPLDKECPKCGKRHAYYPCINCQRLIPTSSMACQSCRTPSYLADAISVVEGGGTGEGAEQIINDFQNIFGIPLKKQAISAFANQQDIINSKFRLESISRQLREILDLLGDYLVDFMSPSKGVKMRDAFSEMYKNQNNGVIELNKIGSPIPSNRIQNIIINREREIQQSNLANSQNTTPPFINDGNEDTFIAPQIHNQQSINNQSDDENDPWGDVNI